MIIKTRQHVLDIITIIIVVAFLHSVAHRHTVYVYSMSSNSETLHELFFFILNSLYSVFSVWERHIRTKKNKATTETLLVWTCNVRTADELPLRCTPQFWSCVSAADASKHLTVSMEQDELKRDMCVNINTKHRRITVCECNGTIIELNIEGGEQELEKKNKIEKCSFICSTTKRTISTHTKWCARTTYVERTTTLWVFKLSNCSL